MDSESFNFSLIIQMITLKLNNSFKNISLCFQKIRAQNHT